jgi:hypothetical protein
MEERKMSVERLHNINEMRCPYCRERGSMLIMVSPDLLPLRVVVNNRVYYVHKKCMDAITGEWISKYAPKQDG